MFIEVVKSKIHRVTVTEANLNYIGSITVDEDLLDAANLIANEKENEQGKNRSRLWRWDGKPQSAAQPLNFGDDEAENLEALNVIQVGGKPYLLAMADDGKVKKQKPSHYFVMDFNRLK